MGQAISSFLTGKNKAEGALKEQLEFLVNSAKEKLDRYQIELEDAFADKSAISRRSIPGNRALRWVREYSVKVTQEESEKVKEAVNSFFNVNKSEDKEDKVLEGFKSIVTAGLKAFLGNAEAGEHEEQKFFVFVQHNAIIRIDVRLWRYNFTSSDVIASSENVLCYIICSSVVDRSQLTFDEMIYLLSEHAGDNDVEAYIDRLSQIWKKMETLPTKSLKDT